jgi:hypothetical protein
MRRDPENGKLGRVVDSARSRAKLAMIPPFEDNGYLPPGVHSATLDGIANTMSITNCRQVDNTRAKMKILEDECRSVESTPEDATMARELTIRSLKKLINQMKEEIARFESRASVRSDVH